MNWVILKMTTPRKNEEAEDEMAAPESAVAVPEPATLSLLGLGA